MPDHFSGLLHQSAPFFGTLGADFPETVIFIPDAPVFNAIRFSMPVGDPLSGIPALCLQIAVLHPVTHFLCSPGSGICTDIGPAADLSAQFHIFIRAKSTGILHPPRLIKEWLSDRPHRILPMVRRHEAPARPAQNGYFDLPHGFQHIGSHSVLIRKRGIRIIDPAVDLPVKMLNKVPVKHGTACPDLPFPVNIQLHGSSPPLSLFYCT